MSYELRDVQFMSATEKKTTLRAWVRFLNSGLKYEHFTKALYEHLIQHCSFIAHYNRSGFYSHYFESGDASVLFLSQFDSRGPCASVEYGSTYWMAGDYDDINKAMITEASVYIPALMDAARRKQENADIACAARLLSKHGITVEGLGISEAQAHPGSETATPVQGLLSYE